MWSPSIRLLFRDKWNQIAKLNNSFKADSLSKRVHLCNWTNQILKFTQKQISNSNRSYVWVYVGSRDGVIRNVPGFKYPNQFPQQCGNFDPRLRTWYTQTAYSRKNIFYLVQTSNAIKRGGQDSKLKTIKQSLTASIMTSDHQDFANIIGFNQDAVSMFKPPYDNQMIKVDEQISNRKLLFDVIQNILPTDNEAVNYEKALLKVLQIFNFSQTGQPIQRNNCAELIIFFFAASNPNAGERDPQKLIQIINSKAKSINIRFKLHFFGFKITQEAIKRPVMRELSCQFKGIYYEIPNIKSQSQFLDKISSYYDFLSHQNQIYEPMWSEPYEDGFGLGSIITVAIPAYFNLRNRKIMIGVVGLDVMLSQFFLYGDSLEEILSKLRRQQLCYNSLADQTVLEEIRGENKCSSVEYPDSGFLCPLGFMNVQVNPFRQPIDTSNQRCCPVEQSSIHIVLIVILSVASIVLGVTIFCIWNKCFRKKPLHKMSYKEIFAPFKDFDQTRIQSQEDVSPIED